jgi:hypothetical protein
MYSPYHRLEVPLNPSPMPEGYSALHELYPGVAMNFYFATDRSNVENEHPCEAEEAYLQKKKETAQYAKKLERKVRKEGGGDAGKIGPHPAVDPDALINDPDLRQLTMNDAPKDRNYNEPPPVPDYTKGELKEMQENAHADKLIEKFTSPQNTKSTPSKKNSSASFSYLPWMFGLAALLLILLVCILVFFNN